MRKKQKELKKLDLTEEEIKEIRRISRSELLMDVLSFIVLLISAAIVVIIGCHIIGV